MYLYLALAALKSIGGFQQADIIRQNGELQSHISDMNAQFADLDAFNAKSAGYSNAARYADVIDSTHGALKSAYASEGVQVGYGTAGQADQDNHIAGLLNTMQIQKSARDAATGFKTQEINIRLGGQTANLQSNLNANAAQSGGVMDAIGTMVTGYQMSNLTGRGRDRDSGTNDQAWTQKTTTVHATPTGDGVTKPPYDIDPGKPTWYPDTPRQGDSGRPGFFGLGPRKDYGYGGSEHALGNYSFTSETGG